MDVAFRFTNGARRAAHMVNGYRINSKSGTYVTSKKEIVESLLSSDLMRRSEIVMLTDANLVNNYLAGDEPDYLDRELLLRLPDQCVVELATMLNLKFPNQVMIARAEMNGQPITDAVKRIIDYYKVEGDVVEDIIEKGKADGLIEQNRQWYSFLGALADKGKTNQKAVAEQTLYEHYNK